MLLEHLFKIWCGRVESSDKGKTVSNVAVLFSNASDRDEQFTSAKIFSANSRGYPRLSNQVRNSSFRN